MIDKSLELILSHSKENLVKMILEESEAIHNFLENPQMRGVWTELIESQLKKVSEYNFLENPQMIGVWTDLIENQHKKDIEFWINSGSIDNKREGLFNILTESK